MNSIIRIGSGYYYYAYDSQTDRFIYRGPACNSSPISQEEFDNEIMCVEEKVLPMKKRPVNAIACSTHPIVEIVESLYP